MWIGGKVSYLLIVGVDSLQAAITTPPLNLLEET